MAVEGYLVRWEDPNGRSHEVSDETVEDAVRSRYALMVDGDVPDVHIYAVDKAGAEVLLPSYETALAGCDLLRRFVDVWESFGIKGEPNGLLAEARKVLGIPLPPEPTPKERDRERCETEWVAAGERIQEWGERRDSEGVTAAEYDQQNYAIALDIHRGANAAGALAMLRRQYDLLAGYLMLRGGTDFINACRAAITEERWCDLVETIARLEWEHVADGRLRWGTDECGNRVAEAVEPGRWHVPPSLDPGHPFDLIQAP